MNAQLNRLAARGFTEANLTALAADLVAWRKSSVLTKDRMLHKLASLCIPFASDGDEYQEAERMIVTFALEHVVRIDTLRTQVNDLKSLIVDICADSAVLNLNDELVERMGAALRTPHQ